MGSEIVCLGEALIDFKSCDPGAAFPLSFSGHPGGSPFNVAIAAARLGASCGFHGQLSHDLFGAALLEYLERNGVDTRGVTRHAAATTLGFVSESAGGVRWSFNNIQTADTLYDPRPRPVLPQDMRFIAFGSISLLSEPSASSITEIITAHVDRCVIVFDPNCRPSLIADEAAYRQRFETWLALAHIVKLSNDDLAWLEPNCDTAAACTRYLSAGASVVILTRGQHGATLYARNHPAGISVPAVETTTVDTVGAGDTFTAALMVALLERGVPDLQCIAVSDWLEILHFAALAAALNCQSAGANPPTRAAVSTAVSSR